MSTTLAPRHIDLLPILPGSSPNVSLPPAPDETSAFSDDFGKKKNFAQADKPLYKLCIHWLEDMKQQNTKTNTHNLTSGLYDSYIELKYIYYFIEQ